MNRFTGQSHSSMTSSSRRIQSERTHYIGGTSFSLDTSYTDLQLLGKGSYGVVVSANSTIHGKRVAIKKVTPVAKTVSDARHVLRELRLLRYCGRHENVISLLDASYREGSDEVYMILEAMDSDLHRIISSPQALTVAHTQHFMYQLLAGVQFLHMNRIIHRDLKPGNLLVTRDCRLRITDFGLARERPRGGGVTGDDDVDEPMTEHVVTRWYRPPELMLCPDGMYNYSIDMWSCGCILAELVARQPLFPGKNFVHQLELVFDVLGSPAPSEVAHIVNGEAKKFLRSQVGKQRAPFARVLPSASATCADLCENLLEFSPSQRITAAEALRHPFFTGVSLPSSMINPELPADEFEFSFEKQSSLTRVQLKNMIVAEVQSLRKEMRQARRGDAGDTTASKTATSGDVPPDTARSTTSQRSDTSKTTTTSRSTLASDALEAARATQTSGLRRKPSTSSIPVNQPGYMRSTARASSAPRPRPTAVPTSTTNPESSNVLPPKPVQNSSRNETTLESSKIPNKATYPSVVQGIKEEQEEPNLYRPTTAVSPSRPIDNVAEAKHAEFVRASLQDKAAVLASSRASISFVDKADAKESVSDQTTTTSNLLDTRPTSASQLARPGTTSQLVRPGNATRLEAKTLDDTPESSPVAAAAVKKPITQSQWSDDEAAPASPIRKSLAQTYASPKRASGWKAIASPHREQTTSGAINPSSTTHTINSSSLVNNQTTDATLKKPVAIAQPLTTDSDTEEEIESLTQRLGAHLSASTSVKQKDNDSSQNNAKVSLKGSTMPPMPTKVASYAAPTYAAQLRTGQAPPLPSRQRTTDGMTHNASSKKFSTSSKTQTTTTAAGDEKPKRKITQAKSPKFSVMSWQRHGASAPEERVPARAASTGRSRRVL